MATSLDKHLLRLLKEFDGLCRSNSIRYVLANHSAWDAAKFNKYHGNMYETAVLMERDQFEQLKSKALPSNRAIVRFKNRGCEAKYADMRSVLLDYKDNPDGSEPYVGIEITVADLDENGYKITKPDGTKGVLGKGAFASIGSSAIEGVRFPVFGDLGAYLTVLVDAAWKKKTYPYVVPKMELSVTHVEDIDPELFLSQPVVKESLSMGSQQMRRLYWHFYREEYQPAIKHYERYRQYLTRTEDRFALWETYYPMKSMIIDMSHDPKNDSKVEVLLGELLDKMWSYKKSGLGFSIDEDLLQVCIPYLVKRHGSVETDAFVAMIPQEYREQDIADTLRARGVNHPLLKQNDEL